MWTRAMLKQRAKDVLRVSYWKAFLVSLILMFTGGGDHGGSFNWNFNDFNKAFKDKGFENRDFGRMDDFFKVFEQPGFDYLPVAIAIICVIFLIILIAIAFRIFLGYPLEIGGKKFFVQSSTDVADLNQLGYAFNGIRYWGVIKSLILRDVYLFFWYLLFIIPGIVKSYAYSMVPFILADNPNIGSKRAIEISKDMTYGEKANIWILDLSFIGWRILGMLALLVGTLFLEPYIQSTKAQLYLVLRQRALDMGLCSYDELLLDRPVRQALQEEFEQLQPQEEEKEYNSEDYKTEEENNQES